MFLEELKKNDQRKAILLEIMPKDLIAGMPYVIYNGLIKDDNPKYFAFPMIGVFDSLINGGAAFRHIQQAWSGALHYLCSAGTYESDTYRFYLDRRSASALTNTLIKEELMARTNGLLEKGSPFFSEPLGDSD